jgi:hypothetical protein
MTMVTGSTALPSCLLTGTPGGTLRGGTLAVPLLGPA